MGPVLDSMSQKVEEAVTELIDIFKEAANFQMPTRPSTADGRLTHWGQVTHICVSKLTIIGSDNGLSPGRRQAIIWTNAVVLFIGPSMYPWDWDLSIETCPLSEKGS